VPRRLALLLGALGLAGVLYRLAGRRAASPPLAPARDPADELRRKLAESREVLEEREEFESAETPVDRAEPAPDVDERRRRVYEEARAAARRMQDSAADVTPPPTAE
jgi:hypothetical protein